MTIQWTAVGFNYYIIAYQLKYFPGNIFVNTYVTALADLLGYLIGGTFMYKHIGIKHTLSTCFSIGTIGSILIILNANSPFFPVFVLIGQFGIASGFCIVWIANIEVFPTLFSVTAFGICNFVSRFVTIFAPNVAEA